MEPTKPDVRLLTSDAAAVAGGVLGLGASQFHLAFAFQPILHASDPTFFPGRAATIYYRPPKEASGLSLLKRTLKAALNRPDDLEIGVLGILHPTVLEKFEISYPCSALEFTLEPFKKELQTVFA